MTVRVHDDGQKARDWLEIRVRTTSECVDAVTFALNEQGAGGVVEEADGVTAYFPYVSDQASEDHVRHIRQFLDRLPSFGLHPGRAQVTTAVRSEDSWADAWKDYFKPQRIGAHIVIRPSWHEYTAKPGDMVVDLDPGMAFGTGTHATTRLCIEMLEKAEVSHKVTYDVGTGSGILAIVAAKLGASRVIGVDTDPIAVQVATENAELNRVDDVIQCMEGDWRALFDNGPADVVVANIIAEVIGRMAPDARRLLKPGGLLITSGIIDTKESLVIEKFTIERFRVVDRLQTDEWVALAFTYDQSVE